MATQVKKFVKSALEQADKVYIGDVATDKYGNRMLADILYSNGNKMHNLAEELIKNDLAVKYEGKTKVKNWCK